MGAPVAWFDITSKDPERIGKFYTQLFGWTLGDSGQPGYSLVDTGALVREQAGWRFDHDVAETRAIRRAKASRQRRTIRTRSRPDPSRPRSQNNINAFGWHPQAVCAVPLGRATQEVTSSCQPLPPVP